MNYLNANKQGICEGLLILFAHGMEVLSDEFFDYAQDQLDYTTLIHKIKLSLNNHLTTTLECIYTRISF